MENQKLIAGNPFIPYSIILSRNDIEKLSGDTQEIYTNFPIPIILKEELEETITDGKKALMDLGKIKFFVMFNEHLLDEQELKKLLEEKRKILEELEQKQDRKKQEMEEYRSHKIAIENQKFTLQLLEDSKQRIKAIEEEQEELQNQIFACKQNKKNTDRLLEENRNNIEQSKLLQKTLKSKVEEYKILMVSYPKYLEQIQCRLRLIKRRKEAERKIDSLKEENEKIEKALENFGNIKKELEKDQAEFEKDLDVFLAYKNQEKEIYEEDYDYVKARIRYNAITEGISENIKDLNENLSQEKKRYDEKVRELKHRNQYGLGEEEYIHAIYSEEEVDRLEAERKQLEKEVNAAKEENSKLEKKLTKLEVKIEHQENLLKEKTGSTQLVERKEIVDTNFPARMRLASHEKEKREKNLKQLYERRNIFQSTQAAMAEYTDYKVTCEMELVSIENFTSDELLKYQGKLRRDLKNISAARNEQKQATENLIEKITGGS